MIWTTIPASGGFTDFRVVNELMQWMERFRLKTSVSPWLFSPHSPLSSLLRRVLQFLEPQTSLLAHILQNYQFDSQVPMTKLTGIAGAACKACSILYQPLQSLWSKCAQYITTCSSTWREAFYARRHPGTY